MKHFLFLCILIGFSTALNAQPFKVAVSPTFDEPTEAGTKVFQCDNGNTLLFSFPTNGIRVTTYNAEHKPSARNLITVASWGGSMKYVDVLGIYNIGEEVIMFVRFSKGEGSALSRLHISPNDGKLLNYATLAETKDLWHLVQKNPESKGYTLALIGDQDKGMQVKLIHFDGTHNLTGSDSFAMPGRFKYKRILGMASKAPGEGIICTYEYNTRSSGGKESRLAMMAFKGGEFQQVTIDSAKDLRETEALVLYNPKADLYEVVTATAEGSSNGFFQSSTSIFSSLVIGIRADDFQIVFGKSLDERALDATAKERYGKWAGFAGLPINASIDADGSLTIITEAMTVSEGDHGTTTTTLGNIGLIKYDATGTLIASALVPNAQLVWRGSFDPLYQKGEQESKVWFHNANPGIYMSKATDPCYYYSRFVNTPSGSFVLLNQHEDDFEHEAKQSPTALRVISGANAVGFRVDGGNLSHFHLFGTPNEETFENRFALFSSGDYSPKTGSFAVVIMEQKRHEEKKARIAWLTAAGAAAQP